MSLVLTGMLGMLRHDLQQGQLEMLKESSKVKSQDLLDNSLTINLEDTNADVYLEKEFEESLQFGAEVEDIDMEDGLTIESLFNIQMYEQIQEETIERSLIVYSQTPTSTSEDCSVFNEMIFVKINGPNLSKDDDKEVDNEIVNEIEFVSFMANKITIALQDWIDLLDPIFGLNNSQEKTVLSKEEINMEFESRSLV
ncbi:21538_t:CDS:2 [Gigaspora margarita]|uniref:21538_t:CDS:1 n=1 Tax=Gigaspora margarita TaxID=4874 RepID=A0ABN7VDL2_GIGMA|nr:21538_t:CDS:2 [Gigaspora margarita]